MASNKPVIHGEDHRPPLWNGPQDIGGPDPLRWLTRTADPEIPSIFVGQTFSGSTVVSEGTSFHVAFNGTATIYTNDPVGAYVFGTVTSPHTGDYYSVDWSSNSNKVNITAAGMYLVSRTFQINALNSGSLIVGQNFIQVSIDNSLGGALTIPFTQSDLSPLATTNIVGVVYAGVGFNGTPAVGSFGVVSVTSTAFQELYVSHQGLQGSATNWNAEISVSRLGNI